MVSHRIEWEGGANGQADPTEATISELAGLDPSDIMVCIMVVASPFLLLFFNMRVVGLDPFYVSFYRGLL